MGTLGHPIDLGSPPVGWTGRPAAIGLDATQDLHVFVRGFNDALLQRFSSNGSFSPWIQAVPDGELTSSPAVASRGPGKIDVVVKGTDGGLWQRFVDNYQWNGAWLPLGKPPEGIVGDPAVLAPGGDELHIFVRDVEGGVWQRFYRNGAWSGWIQPPGTESGELTSSPAPASLDPGRIAIFGRGTDFGLWMTQWELTHWTPWKRLGQVHDIFQGDPSALGRLSRFDVVVRGTNDALYNFPTACP
jgi:hypothetical protein